jgi:hypothetical protein
MMGVFDNANTTTLGFCGSIFRQEIGFAAGGMSPTADHTNYGSSSVNYAHIGHGNYTSPMAFDLSYNERARDYHKNDGFGTQNGNNKGTWASSRYFPSIHEALFEGNAARCIASIVMTGSTANELKQMIADSGAAGFKTYTWELATQYPEIYAQHEDTLKALGYIDEVTGSAPVDGFNYNGYISTDSSTHSARQKAMSNLLADIREHQANQRGFVK